MLTPQEYLAMGIPANHQIWLSAMDIITHCLQKDTQQTFFKDKRPVEACFSDWSDAMQERVKFDDTYNDIMDNAFHPQKAFTTSWDDSGTFDTGAYISGEDFCFEDERSTVQQGDAVSALIDLSVNCGQRDMSYMETRHKKCYELVMQCINEDRPIQIVGVKENWFPELNKHLKIFIVIKDYTDSIFPSIWGVIKNNRTTNDFANVLADYFIGTHAKGNGRPQVMEKAEQYFPENEELIIFGSRIKVSNGVNATTIED